MIGREPPVGPEPGGVAGSADVAGRSADAGIHTFLIADVRGYTLFTQERGDEAAAKLAAKFAAMAREGVEARGGSVIELRGDEALAVFASARQAIRAALDLQDLFLHETVAEPNLPLYVGIGLDAGEAVPVEAGYRGGALNLAARLCGRAAAGEVLTTREVTHLARKIDGVRYEDRGPVQLKGLADPVTIIRVVAEDSDPAARLAVLNPPPPAAPAPGEPSRPRSPWPRRAVAGAAAMALVLAGLGVYALARPKPAATPAVTGCQVAVGDLNDNSFNQAVYQGLTKAVTDLGISARAKVSTSERQDMAALAAFAAQGCSLIVTQTNSQEAMVASAQHNPTQKYVLIDPFEAPALPNVLGVHFDVEQAAFLAGYLAAGVSHSGTVATFGGIPIPTVLPYMDGFAAGILKYNADHGTHVRLLGWDPATGTGSFISQSDFSAFGNTKRAREIAQGLIAKGADILFPVAGGAGDGGAQAARAAGGVLLVGVDFDAFFQSPAYADLWLTSVRKRYDVAVEDVMKLVVDGTFHGGGLFHGTLANGSMDLAPYHELNGRVPGSLRSELRQVQKGIEDGSVSVDPHDYFTG